MAGLVWLWQTPTAVDVPERTYMRAPDTSEPEDRMDIMRICMLSIGSDLSGLSSAHSADVLLTV